MAFNAERLREARIRKGMNQRELAELCGISDVQLSRYETGRMQPALENLESIARHLQVSADYLLNLTDDPQKIYNNDLEINERLMVETYRREGWAGVVKLGVEHITDK